MIYILKIMHSKENKKKHKLIILMIKILENLMSNVNQKTLMIMIQIIILKVMMIHYIMIMSKIQQIGCNLLDMFKNINKIEKKIIKMINIFGIEKMTKQGNKTTIIIIDNMFLHIEKEKIIHLKVILQKNIQIIKIKNQIKRFEKIIQNSS